MSLSREGGVENESIADTKSFSTLAQEPYHFRVLCSRFAEGYEFSDPEFATGEGGKNKIDVKSLRGRCERRALTELSIPSAKYTRKRARSSRRESGGPGPGPTPAGKQRTPRS